MLHQSYSKFVITRITLLHTVTCLHVWKTFFTRILGAVLLNITFVVANVIDIFYIFRFHINDIIHFF